MTSETQRILYLDDVSYFRNSSKSTRANAYNSRSEGSTLLYGVFK